MSNKRGAFQTKTEIFFSCDDNTEPISQALDGHDLNEYFICRYDREDGYVMVPSEICKSSKYNVEFTANAFYKIVCKGELFGAPLSENEFITEEEFVRILREHSEFFDFSANKNAQSTAYGYFLAD